MKNRTFLRSLNDAVEGFIYVVRNERNMRVHFLLAGVVLLLAILVGVDRTGWIMLSGAIALVLAAEMMNTAIEETIDLVKDGFHPAARVVKHISAGIVLVSAVNALVTGYLVFSRYALLPLESLAFRIRRAPSYATFLSLFMVVFIVIAVKASSRRGSPFRGGLVSGHAAIAFSLWTAVCLTQNNLFVIGVTLALALLVAQSRLRSKIHSPLEVAGGAAIGLLTTALIFQLFFA